MIPKINGILFKAKPLEVKKVNKAWLLPFNPDTGELFKSAKEIKNKKNVYKNVAYHQFLLVNWHIQNKKVKGSSALQIHKIDTINLQKDAVNGGKIPLPVFIAIETGEFQSVWFEIYNTKVKSHNIRCDIKLN